MRELEDQIIYGLEKLCSISSFYLEKKAKDFGLSSLQLKILEYLERRCVSSLTDIALEFEITKATVSDSINGLVKKGFVEKRVTEIDKRRKKLVLTRKGKEVVGDLRFNEKILEEFFSENGREIGVTFLNILKKILLSMLEKKAGQRIIVCPLCGNFIKKEDGFFYCTFLNKKFSMEEIRLNCKKFFYKKNN